MNISLQIKIFYIFLIVILGFSVYASVLKAGFVWDDEDLVVDNTYIRDFRHWPEIFTKDLGSSAGVKFNFYRPAQTVSYLVDYHFFGLDPMGYHLMNVGLHISVAVVMFLLFQLLLDGRMFPAFLAASLFVVHPVHASVVCYISSRADLLCVLFMLLSFLYYLRLLKTRQGLDVWMGAIFYTLALLSKEYAIVLPLLIFVYHVFGKVQVESQKVDWIVMVSAAYILLRTLVLPAIVFPLQYNVPLVLKIPGFFVAFKEYLRILFFPQGLHMVYGNFLFHINNPSVIFGFVLWGGLVVFMLARRFQQSLLSFAVGWFLVALLPVSIFPINAFMAESWLYAPSVGFFLAVGLMFKFLFSKVNLRWMGLVIFTGFLCFYVLVTERQIVYWQTPLAFYEWTSSHAPFSTRILYHLGQVYLKEGRLSEAKTIFERIVKISPADVEAKACLERMDSPLKP